MWQTDLQWMIKCTTDDNIWLMRWDNRQDNEWDDRWEFCKINVWYSEYVMKL